VGLLAHAAGCASYSERLDLARQATMLGDYPVAIGELNRSMDVGSGGELPDKWKGDRALAALERASLLQATEAFEESAENLNAAGQELELLEIAGDPVGELGRYVYSDSAADYRLPASERLAINSVNMLNYLARDDLASAAVEARRFTVEREYLEGLDLPATGSVFGSYLAGLVFEKIGEGDRALRYYDEALADGPLRTLAAPVSRLAARYSYRGPGIKALLESGPARSAAQDQSEIVVVMSLGRVPFKIPERIPIGAAVGLAGAFISGNPAVLEHSLFKVVVYPELTPSLSAMTSGRVSIDEKPSQVELLVDLGAKIRHEYQALKPRIIGAALSRMIVRAAAAEGMRAAGRQTGGSGDLVGFLLAAITEGTLVALDKPDTRSWSFLADRIFVSRRAVSPGPHQVVVELQGEGVVVKRSFDVTVPKGKIAVLVVTEPR
jgi:tetratricopeptide (TPR) repeat protein